MEIFEMSGKVFCKNCEHFCSSAFDVECWHPENCVEEENWYGPYTAFAKSPAEINKNMDCKWYKQANKKTGEVPVV